MRNSDRRTAPRTEVHASAIVQTLGETAAANGTPFLVEVADASPRGMRLISPQRIGPGQALKIEVGDAMFLGEACYCAPADIDGTESFSVGVVTDECLSGLNGLQHLIQALRGESAREVERTR